MTARYVIKYDNIWISYLTSEKDLTTTTVRCRVVYENRKADIAILKADLATERFLQIRNVPLEKGVAIFSGSWFHMRAFGTCMRVGKLNKNSYTIEASIPLMAGDSGSPLIDEQGYLCGIANAA